ncbi:hypothetical protein F5882DRAFT_377366 [Hyaloscypha sp. PMI_1271]|nr:hypothetical protein F5882DRAFT_377366 [Hyaloscypha sp. PMI_1271]
MKEQTRAPAIMHTCRESREEGKHFYTVCVEKASNLHRLGWSPTNPETISGAKSVVWVNFGIDRFVYESGYNTSFRRYYEVGFNFDRFVLKQIRHLGLANTKVSNLVWGINELYYGRVLSIKKLKSFKIIQRMSGIEHNKGCPLRELIMDKIRNEVAVNKKTWGWKVRAKIEWRSREAKHLPRRSENASVVTADEEMIWQLEETTIL